MNHNPSPISVTILGSTGSVGRQAIALLQNHPAQFQLQTLVAQNNWQLLAEQATALRPRYAVIANPEHYAKLREILSPLGVVVAAGPSAVLDAAAQPVDVCVAGIVGCAGLAPTMAALRAARRLAFASKECLICAGNLFLAEAMAGGCTIIPTDSEHSAIFQLLLRSDRDALSRIILTASGGPFLHHDAETLATVTPEQAANHPVWKMGKKISIDSATLMNKALEIIEAHYLFALSEDKIQVLIHPQSIVHALIALNDGAMMAHLALPDMQIPLAYALFWPKRAVLPDLQMDLAAVAQWQFMPPDEGRFPSLALARAAIRTGGEAPLALNAANEIAVARFLAGDIKFTEMAVLLQTMMERWQGRGSFGNAPPDLSHILALDTEFRQQAEAWQKNTLCGFTPIRAA